MPEAYALTRGFEAPRVRHRGSSFSRALRSQRATSRAPMADLIWPSTPPLKAWSQSFFHSPTTPRGSSPTSKCSSWRTWGPPPGAIPVTPSSVST
jgi:hypothetical protein